MRRLAGALLVLTFIAQTGTPARAATSGQGGFCDLQPGLCAGIGDHDDGPDTVVPRSVRALSRWVWRRVETTGGQTCKGQDGRQVFLRLIDRATNQVINERFRCPDPTVHAESLPLPPPPEVVWDQVPLPKPEIKINPVGYGLVGLPTWLWYDQPGSATLTLPLGEFAVTLTARAVRYHWRMGDGTEITAATPGSEPTPAGTHVYEAIGDYTVRLDVTWAGTYTFSGPGTDPITIDLGERTFTGQRPYHVVEIRSVKQ